MNKAGDLADFLGKQAMLRPTRVALVEHKSKRSFTYAGLDRRADAAARLLLRSGVGEGDRVGIICRNRPEFFELLFACARIGAILVPLNWRMTAAELHVILDDCTPSLVICGPEDQALLAAVWSDRPTLLLDEGYEEALAQGGEAQGGGAMLRRAHPADGIWYLIYTSGTTGVPKGVIYTFGMAIANFVNLSNAIGLTAADRTLNFLPFFHTAGINLHSLPTLIAGGQVLVLDRFDAETVVALIEARRIDTFFAVPTVYRDLFDHPRFGAAPLGQVRHWSCGGAALPAEIAERAQALGIRLCNGLGMTETGPTAFLQMPEETWESAGSIGRPQLLCRVRIVDEDGRDVADGKVGEILFSGPSVTPGYWGGESVSGWLRSGDFGFRDECGAYCFVGRRSDMFISGGEHVHPAEVETALMAHDAIEEAAVIAVPHERWGEVGHAFIKLKRGASAEPHALEQICRSRLASYKVPRTFEVVSDFPRTATGKVRKHLLRV